MTKREAERRQWLYSSLMSLGFTFDECEKMRRISSTLHRWFELECGDSTTYCDYAIERDDSNGLPYMVKHLHGQGVSKTIRYRVADRETGARNRLDRIVQARNNRTNAPVDTYIQTDPRGAPLYILRPGDVPAGAEPSSYYSRGICIY
jgi:hypothetical protein